MGTTESVPAGYGTAAEILDRIGEQAEKLVREMNADCTGEEFVNRVAITFSAMVRKFLEAMRDESQQEIALAVVAQLLTEAGRPGLAEPIIRRLS